MASVCWEKVFKISVKSSDVSYRPYYPKLLSYRSVDGYPSMIEVITSSLAFIKLLIFTIRAVPAMRKVMDNKPPN